MHSSAPTQREIVLVVLLLTSLIFFFRNGTSVRHPTLDANFLDSEQASSHSEKSRLAIPPLPQNTRLSWGSESVPRTRIVAHVPGWTIFDKMYVFNGTFYIVTDEPEVIPERKYMISAGIPIVNGPEQAAARLPTDKHMRVITAEEAKKLFGTGANRMQGVTWLVNDPHQFITHYYHWSAELFFGFWRAYSTLDPLIPANGKTSLPPPRQLLFAHVDAGHWRDYASMNQWVLRTAFPSVKMEFSQDWEDRVAMGVPLVFDRILIADRAAAINGENFGRTQRTAAEPFALPGSPNWWSTYRNNVIEFSGLNSSVGEGTRGKPVITYISRQGWGRRMLIQEDHERLVEELYRLRDEKGYEVNVVSMDKLSRIEQLQLAGRTTIMMGVHGNGLTSLIWMKPSPRSTVMEFFFPGGFAHDYEYTTRALGMVHFGFWGDSAFTRPDVPPVAYPEGFQGNEIPIDGRVVARLIQERLTLADEADD
ncbi:hypothetical protein EVG20_g6724 [Dentipellis fragilis]|uniref:Glycosyltransferase 61 catalytic domain-containing protein n=1 Tax=Dentipellis fragilis TaxID=205917 RepID=A0A4Y9YL92_9AGAM|nr:hypothetical protein EVG20_g6724 [Dentipellis fragilis]